jgi:hypothetical protein
VNRFVWQPEEIDLEADEMDETLTEGRHSWNPGDHPRDGDGQFASTGGDSQGGAPTGDYAGRRRTGSGGSNSPPTLSSGQGGMPGTLATSRITLASGGTLAMQRRDDGTTTIGDSGPFTPSQTQKVLSTLGLADDWDPGDDENLPGVGKVTRERGGVRLDLDDGATLKLTHRDVTRMEREAEQLDKASRVDTGNGDLDVYMDGKKVGFRSLGDDGQPVEVTFNRASASKISRTIDGFIDDIDDPDTPDKAVHSKTITTSAGKVQVSLHGDWGGTGSGDRLVILPVDDDKWGMVIDGPRQGDWARAVSDIIDEAAPSKPLPGLQPLREATAALAEIQQGEQVKGRFKVLLIRSGWGSSGYYSETVLRRDGPAIWPEGTHMYLNHPTPAESMDRPEGDVQNWASVTTSAPAWDPVERGLVADVQVFPQWRGLLNEEFATRVGLSIRASGQVEYGEAEGREGPIVTSLDEGISVDWVTRAGAGGRVLQLIESARTEGELLRQATEAKAPPFKKKDADPDDQDKPDDAEGTEPDEGEDEDDLPSFIKAKIKAKAKVSEARNVGHWLESRLHRAFTEMADDMFGEGRLTREERIALSQAIGEGLTAFNTKVADQMPHLYERDLWDDPTPAADAAPETAAPVVVAASKNEPGSSPADPKKKEGEMPELTEAQARELQEARTTAEADKAAALQEAADAKLMLARFTALEAARPIATRVLAESGLPAGAQSKLLAAVTSDSVPLTGENALDEAALKTSVEESAKAEATYLASLAEGDGAGQPRGLGESATSSASPVPDAATVTALEETYKSRGLSPEAARLAAVGRP